MSGANRPAPRSRARGRALPSLAAGVLSLLLAGCGNAYPAVGTSTTGSPSAGTSTGTGTGTGTGTIRVDAAASLSGSFDAIASAFERRHPGVNVVLNYGGSSGLAAAIVGGAPIDVFAAASPATMSTVATAHLTADRPEIFARNILEIAVPAGNRAQVTGLRDFTDPARKIALCAPEVPCGAAARKVFAIARLTPRPDTLEQDVKAALVKVTHDEVDAALVYHTDILAAGRSVEGVPFPEAQQAVNDYPIAALSPSRNLRVSRAFVAFVLGATGQKVLAHAGFEPK